MTSLEAKRTQFRKYLERSGVIDALSKALIKLYEEPNKPDDAIRFVRKYMCETCLDDDRVDALRAEYDEANKMILLLETELERLKEKVPRSIEEIAAELEEQWQELVDDEPCKSLLKRYFTKEVLDELKMQATPEPVNSNLLDCVKSGLIHHSSVVGLYAADAACYDVFKSLFDPIIMDYHGLLGIEEEVLQKETDWGDPQEIENVDPERKYVYSARIRINRNLEEYPYFAKMTEDNYKEVEEKVSAAVTVLGGELTGNYFSMKDLDFDTQAEMYKRGILFKRGDDYLTAAGDYRYWSTGRGVYHNPDETFLIWVNEQDHLKIISTTKCGDLGDVYQRLVCGIKGLEKRLVFSTHPRYGNLTACPTNLGTTLRASVQVRLPNLALDRGKLNIMAQQMNLTIRGAGGENTAIEDGLMDVSNKRCLGFTEFELVKTMQDGVMELIKAEQECEDE